MINDILTDKILRMKNVENTFYSTGTSLGWHKNEPIMNDKDKINRMEPYHLFSKIAKSDLQKIENIEYFLKQNFDYRCFYLTIEYGGDFDALEYDTNIIKELCKNKDNGFYGEFISYNTLAEYGGGLSYLLKKKKVDFSTLYYSGTTVANVIRVYNIPQDLKA